mmetsp:Transcript_32736/g.49337  ORF Transcript_32736/g.49337 Transcript_32736/m.49337 type:complete len:137 (+) Transcript_32736:86-496(+)|eukprot:CAMPEP_0178922786 /NCGR_PEP_ID=MMETSP0786-20121207/16350_1 /TAXON_ID=186022 /ORGANISM="Thalassionema frauenfeldii, Strain CCMP 1798" /LENGTH=136 /DNA_ID=CAMNT_0020597195 /DNA_START=30 /DNA_END=440 /DNA_ORIENTATION=+
MKAIRLACSKRLPMNHLRRQHPAIIVAKEPLLQTGIHFSSSSGLRRFATSKHVTVTESKSEDAGKEEDSEPKILKAACGDVTENQDEEEEEEEMFVDAFEGFAHKGREWGGPTRGGRFPEPTRYGDWERKGRCTDF